jgi:hypothetical protein
MRLFALRLSVLYLSRVYHIISIAPLKLTKAACSNSLCVLIVIHHITSYPIPSISQGVTEVRVLQIRRVNLTKLPPKPLLLLLADPTLSSLLVATLVLPHIVQSPANDQNELNAKRYGSSDGSGNWKRKKK